MSAPASGAVTSSTRSPLATRRIPRPARLTSRSPSRSSTTLRSTPARTAISRRVSGSLGDEQEGLEGRLGQLARRLGTSLGVRLDGPARGRPGRRPAPSSAASISGPSGAVPASAVVGRGVRTSRATIGPHGSACSRTTSRCLASSRRARNVTATTTRSRTSRRSSWRTIAPAAPQGRPDDLGALADRDARGPSPRAAAAAGGTIRTSAARASRRTTGSSGGAAGGREPAMAAAWAAAGSRRNRPIRRQCALLEAQPAVAERPVEEEAGAQLGLGIAALVGERLAGRVGRSSWQHRPALDEDELAGDRHERRDVADPVALERGERLEVGAGEQRRAGRSGRRASAIR